MLTLGASIAGAILEMADHENLIQFGLGNNRGHFSASCNAPTASANAVYPPAMKVDMSSSGGTTMWGFGGADVPKVVVELSNVAPTCVNKISHLEPCAAHDDEDGDYFKCKFTGSAGEIEMPAQKAYADWIWVLGVRTKMVSKINCTTPDSSGIIAATGYDGTLAYQDGANLELSIIFGNSTSKMELPFTGEPGTNIITYQGWLTPPMSPSPPGIPPPPWVPCGHGCAGNMLQSYLGLVTAMDFGSSSYPFPGGFGTLCHSSTRGDTLSSSAFHSACDTLSGDRKSIFFARVKYGDTYRVNGAYTRISWYADSSGTTVRYGSDDTAGLFQAYPVVFKSTAGSGPYTGSANANYRSNNYGPTYGSAHDWTVSSNMITGYANLGYTYKCRVGNYGQNTCRDDFIGSYSAWSIVESEMWIE